MNDNNHSTMSFDRMRNMLVRAAEIRESEQQQIFDALDEIHARMSPLESLGSMRKRLSDLPDRSELTLLAERLDEALGKLEVQEGALAGLDRAVDSMIDRLAKPFAQLDGRLDGVSGRFEGVAGRMDGLEDKLGHIHKRLDELETHLDRQDGKLDALPSAVQVPLRERLEALETVLRGRIDEVDEGVHEHLDGTREALQRSITDVSGALQATLVETRDSLHGKVDETRDVLQERLTQSNDSVHAKLDDLLVRPAVDPTDRLDALARRLDSLTSRLDEVGGRLDTVESGVTARLNHVAGTLDQRLQQVHATVGERPDADSLVSLVRDAHEESERRHAGQLDEAMATFAELILGGGAPAAPAPMPTALPRPQRRAPRKAPGKVNDKGLDLDDMDLAAEA